MKRFFSILLAFVLLVTGIFMSACNKQNENTETTTAPVETTTVAPVPANTNPLTGKLGYNEANANSKPICVVVENSPDARPQWGITTPDILIEYEVEGGISRMLWLYADASLVPDKIGPVRSARHDIVELTLGLDGIFVHAGGSSYALDKIADYKGTLNEIDGNNYYSCFVRDTSRNVGSEHTYCLIGDDFRAAITDLQFVTAHKENYVSPFVFTQETAVRTPAAGASKIDFSYSASYNYTFTYSAETSKYNCSLNDNARVDANGEQCAYTNVLVLYVDMTDMKTSSGHQDLELEKGGSGLLATAGGYEEIRWEKGEDTDNLKLFNAAGEQLTLNPGTSYIGFVRSTRAAQTTVQ